VLSDPAIVDPATGVAVRVEALGVVLALVVRPGLFRFAAMTVSFMNKLFKNHFVQNNCLYLSREVMVQLESPSGIYRIQQVLLTI
jgi:hypothetical protein